MDKYNWEEHEHFITEDCKGGRSTSEKAKRASLHWTVQRSSNRLTKKYSLQSMSLDRDAAFTSADFHIVSKISRLLYRSIIWSSHDEEDLHKWFSTNYNVEVHAYVKNGKYCVVNNTYEPQRTTVYRGDGSCFDLDMEANEIKWYEI